VSSERVAARVLPQQQVMVGAAQDRMGTPSRLQSVTQRSESERVRLRVAWTALSHAEMQGLATLRSRAGAISP
jgi:hypothetical protein